MAQNCARCIGSSANRAARQAGLRCTAQFPGADVYVSDPFLANFMIALSAFLLYPRSTRRLAGRGPMAEWLRRGLQILAPEFDSRSGLQLLIVAEK